MQTRADIETFACNPDYQGGMICRSRYPGASACTRHGGKMLCLKDMETPAKRDWILPASIEKE